MQDTPPPEVARKKRDYSGRVYKPRKCEDCPAVYVPGGSGQRRCADCQREVGLEQSRRHEARRSRHVPAALGACLDCAAPIERRRKRCDDCRPVHLERLRLMALERRRIAYTAKPARQSWPPTDGLEPRECTTCSAQFQPYRRNQFECSPECRDSAPERIQARREISKRFNAKPENAAAIKGRRRVRSIRGHGLTPEQYEEMLDGQHGVCALCGNPPDPDGPKCGRKLHIDHDHATGLVRALLCMDCNLGLGRFRDNADVLRKAAAFVEFYRLEEGMQLCPLPPPKVSNTKL